eukprot:scaffold31485_cov57-Phaeocystis_antarctica.AAC.5
MLPTAPCSVPPTERRCWVPPTEPRCRLFAPVTMPDLLAAGGSGGGGAWAAAAPGSSEVLASRACPPGLAAAPTSSKSMEPLPQPTASSPTRGRKSEVVICTSRTSRTFAALAGDSAMFACSVACARTTADLGARMARP